MTTKTAEHRAVCPLCRKGVKLDSEGRFSRHGYRGGAGCGGGACRMYGFRTLADCAAVQVLNLRTAAQRFRDNGDERNAVQCEKAASEWLVMA